MGGDPVVAQAGKELEDAELRRQMKLEQKLLAQELGSVLCILRPNGYRLVRAALHEADDVIGASALADQGPTPPRVPEFMLALLASTAQQEGALGDLNERFDRDCEAYGAD